MRIAELMEIKQFVSVPLSIMVIPSPAVDLSASATANAPVTWLALITSVKTHVWAHVELKRFAQFSITSLLVHVQKEQQAMHLDIAK